MTANKYEWMQNLCPVGQANGGILSHSGRGWTVQRASVRVPLPAAWTKYEEGRLGCQPLDSIILIYGVAFYTTQVVV
jgi:hypothetical protein